MPGLTHETLGHLLGGKWFLAKEEKPLITTSPIDGSKLYQGSRFPLDRVPEVVEQAIVAQKTWQKVPVEKRIHLLHVLEEILSQTREELTQALIDEIGKTSWEAHQEIDACLSKINQSIESLESTKKRSLISTEKKELFVVKKPLGACLVLSPFNFPLHLALGQIVPLLLAGNSVILKPSELAPLCGQLLSECIVKACDQLKPQIPSLFQMVQGGGDVGDRLVREPKIRGIFFTGSDRVGKSIEETSHAISGRMVALEMGGNNPLVISSYRHLEQTIMLIIMSAYLTSGQRCTSARRLIVVDSPENRKLVEELAQKVATIPIGNPKTKQVFHGKGGEPFMGPLISPVAVSKILSRFCDLVKKGAKPMVSPLECLPSTCYINPLLIDVTGCKLADEEDFGPLLKVIFVPSFLDAIQEANTTRFGLSAALISEDEKEFQTFFDTVSFGIINWNCPTTGASSRAPFGGIGDSGNFRPAGFSMVESCCYPVSATKDKSAAFLESLPEHMRTLASTVRP